MAKAVEALKAGGLAPPICDQGPHRPGAPSRPVHRNQPAPARRRGQRQVVAISARMARIAGEVVREARRLAINARRRLRDWAAPRHPSSALSPATWS